MIFNQLNSAGVEYVVGYSLIKSVVDDTMVSRDWFIGIHTDDYKKFSRGMFPVKKNKKSTRGKFHRLMSTRQMTPSELKVFTKNIFLYKIAINNEYGRIYVRKDTGYRI